MGFPIKPGFPINKGFAIKPGFAVNKGFAVDPAAALKTSLLAQALAVVQQKQGSLWVPSPQYNFVESNGTGASAADTPLGFATDLNGLRPMTQATSANKAMLRRVPLRLGPELVTNGDFSAGSAGWALQSGFSVGVGVLSIANPASGNYANQTVGIVNSKHYLVTYEIKNYVSGIVRVNLGRMGATVGASRTATGVYSEVLVAAGTFQEIVVQANAASTVADVDGISVREVLEWTWAWDFDGANDSIATATLPAVAAESMIVAKDFDKQAVSGHIMSKGVGSNGMTVYTDPTAFCGVATGTGAGQVYGGGMLRNSILSAVAATGLRKVRENGATIRNASDVYSSLIRPLSIGANNSGLSPAKGLVFGAAYFPAALTDAECLIIERYLASLTPGVTL
ncbi:hypothetical protein [Chitinibacter sp. GC72]|uniref:hypothetical protein n=1 Tax=Chitinibacter sp. GC72 TaxID=1526917 RepID=UPI0012FA2946|nr:hypothetical protein [Chitinibacter sp. GC72]